MARNSFVQINDLGLDEFPLCPCCQPDLAQEVVKFLAHVEVDLDWSFAPPSVELGLCRSCAGHWWGLRVVLDLTEYCHCRLGVLPDQVRDRVPLWLARPLQDAAGQQVA